MQKISVVIPAFNEESTIVDVLQVVARSRLAHETIVVDDGSTDSTGALAEQEGAKVVRLPKNSGKGNAMSAGLKEAKGEIVLFLDADLIGLQARHIDKLVVPVLLGEVKMTVGKFHAGAFWTTLSQYITPFLSGQRAIEKKALQGFQNMEKLGFGVETALTIYFKKNKLPHAEVLLDGLNHRVKEKKFGFWNGFFRRIKMYGQILRSLYRY